MNLMSLTSSKTSGPHFPPKVENWERKWRIVGLTLPTVPRLVEGKAKSWSLVQVDHLDSLMRRSMTSSIAVVEQNCCMKSGGKSASNLENSYKEYNQNTKFPTISLMLKTREYFEVFSPEQL
jgi:hypothetical protein